MSAMRIEEIEAKRRAAGGFLPANVVRELVEEGTPLDELLLALVPLARKLAIPPISNFYVGAVAYGTSGSIYFGANYEFAGESLTFTVHAEQAAVAQAVSFGERGIERIAVSAAPCGLCRQFLNELTTAAQLTVLLPEMAATPLSALLPSSFGPRDLDVKDMLLAPHANGLSLATNDELEQAALDAANRSYAPYSRSYAGVALRTSGGTIHTGPLAENAAFNPTLAPMEAALVDLVIRGGKTYGDITEAVLVEVEGAIASQIETSRIVLRAVSDVELRTRGLRRPGPAAPDPAGRPSLRDTDAQ